MRFLTLGKKPSDKDRLAKMLSPPQASQGAIGGEQNRWEAIHWTMYRSEKVEVQHLIAEGADPNATDPEGWTPLACAIFGDMQTFGLQFGSKKQRAAYRQRHRECREIIELLIGSGADVNGKTVGGVTILQFAGLMGSAEFVALIKRHGGKSSVVGRVLARAFQRGRRRRGVATRPLANRASA